MVESSNRAQPGTPTLGKSRFRRRSFGGQHGGTSAFGQRPAFGVFGSPNISQSSPFGCTFGQTQPIFGTQPFDTSSQPVSTAASTSSFRSTSTPVFGSTSSTQDAGSVPVCGVSSSSVFGASSTPAVGDSTTPFFGFISTIAFGQLAPSFGAAPIPAFGSNTTFGSTPSPFDKNSAFGAQSTHATFEGPGFGQTSFGGQGGGSRVTPYTSTNEPETVLGQAPGKLISISSMPQYKDKSHEELRWEDYQLGDKGASAFGAFGSRTLGQSNPSGSTFGQNQASFGNQPFGAISQPASGATSTPVFGSTMTQAFGTTTSALGATSGPAFGASSTPTFWVSRTPTVGASSTPPFSFGSTVTLGQPVAAFGAASTPAFGNDTPFESTSSPFGQSSAFGASAFGQKNAFGAFGSQTLGQLSPSRSTFGQKQATFGNQPFGSISQPASGATSTPLFGSTMTPAFGTRSSALGATSGAAFGASSTPAFWISSTPTVGASSTPPFTFGSTVTLGQPVTAFGATSTPAFGNDTPFGSTSSPFGQSLSFGAQFAIPTFGIPEFGQTSFVGQHGGSRVTLYTSTSETEGASYGEAPVKLISISSMPQYKVKSHEELRWEDYAVGDKGGLIPARQQPAGENMFSKPLQSNSFGQTPPAFGTSTFGLYGLPSLGQSSPFRSTFGQTQPASGNLPFGAISQPSSGATSTPAFLSTLTPAFGATTSALGATSVPAFGAFSSPVFGISSTPAIGTLNNPPFGFGITVAFGQLVPAFGTASMPSFGNSKMFRCTSSPFGQSLHSDINSYVGDVPSQPDEHLEEAKVEVLSQLQRPGMQRRLDVRFLQEMADQLSGLLDQQGVHPICASEIMRDPDLAQIWRSLPRDMGSLMCHIVAATRILERLRPVGSTSSNSYDEGGDPPPPPPSRPPSRQVDQAPSPPQDDRPLSPPPHVILPPSPAHPVDPPQVYLPLSPPHSVDSPQVI